MLDEMDVDNLTLEGMSLGNIMSDGMNRKRDVDPEISHELSQDIAPVVKDAENTNIQKGSKKKASKTMLMKRKRLWENMESKKDIAVPKADLQSGNSENRDIQKKLPSKVLQADSAKYLGHDQSAHTDLASKRNESTLGNESGTNSSIINTDYSKSVFIMRERILDTHKKILKKQRYENVIQTGYITKRITEDQKNRAETVAKLIESKNYSKIKYDMYAIYTPGLIFDQCTRAILLSGPKPESEEVRDKADEVFRILVSKQKDHKRSDSSKPHESEYIVELPSEQLECVQNKITELESRKSSTDAPLEKNKCLPTNSTVAKPKVRKNNSTKSPIIVQPADNRLDDLSDSGNNDLPESGNNDMKQSIGPKKANRGRRKSKK